MAEVEFYGWFEKHGDERIAKHSGVRAALVPVAQETYEMARAKLAMHRFEGYSEVKLERGSLDWFVVLDDTSAPDANALAIESKLYILRGARDDLAAISSRRGNWIRKARRRQQQ